MSRPLMTGLLLALPIFAAPSLLSPAQAQGDARAAKIARYLDHLGEHDKFMGSVAISIDGNPIVIHQVGTRTGNGEEAPAVNKETRLRIGSITKTFTSVMILQLIEEEKLTLETKLASFFPDLKNADQITVEQLLRHRSGIGSITSDPTYVTWNTQAKSRPEMLEKISQQPTRFQPGERAEYSNTNYLLLGYIIEELTSNSYADALKTRIVDRIGLKHTAYMTMADAEKNVALSYTRSGDLWKPHSETDPSIPHGAGAIMSTPSDLVVFIESLFAGKLINEASLKEMTTIVDRMGLGIMQAPFGSRRAFSHNGGIDGFQSSLGYFPNDKVAISLIGNGWNYNMNDVMIGLLSITFDVPFELPSLETMDVEVEKLKRYEGVYAAEGFPLKITVKLNGKQLSAQATGQGAFPLTPNSDADFKFDPAGIQMSFSQSTKDGEWDAMRLKQAGQDIAFKKEAE